MAYFCFQPPPLTLPPFLCDQPRFCKVALIHCFLCLVPHTQPYQVPPTFALCKITNLRKPRHVHPAIYSIVFPHCFYSPIKQCWFLSKGFYMQTFCQICHYTFWIPTSISPPKISFSIFVTFFWSPHTEVSKISMEFSATLRDITKKIQGNTLFLNIYSNPFFLFAFLSSSFFYPSQVSTIGAIWATLPKKSTLSNMYEFFYSMVSRYNKNI